MAELRAAVELAPEEASHRVELAHSLFEVGEDEAAEAELAKALDLSPSLVAARVEHAKVLRKLCRVGEAAKQLTAATRLAPDDPSVGLATAHHQMHIASAEARSEVTSAHSCDRRVTAA